MKMVYRLPTPRAIEAYRFIREHYRAEGYSPTFQEIADHMGVKSASVAYKWVDILEDAGWIQRDCRKVRAILPVHGLEGTE